MSLELRKLGVFLQHLQLANKRQRGIGMGIQKGQTGRDSDDGAKVPAHGVDSYPDHAEIGVSVVLTVSKRKARKKSGPSGVRSTVLER